MSAVDDQARRLYQLVQNTDSSDAVCAVDAVLRFLCGDAAATFRVSAEILVEKVYSAGEAEALWELREAIARVQGLRNTLGLR